MEQKHGGCSMLKKYIETQVKESIKLKKNLLEDVELMHLIEELTIATIDVYKNGGKTLLAGNGGSAADAQHIAGEFVSKFYFDRPGLSSFALTTDTSVITAIGNDYGYEEIFSRQIQANGNKGDMFIGISTSGNSKNILQAIKECRKKGIISVGLTGQNGGQMAELCDYCIKVPSNETPRVQEVHILIGHIICAVVEEAVYGKGF
jgi:D-sedoheptulose 7-phosphate isomerase